MKRHTDTCARCKRTRCEVADPVNCTDTQIHRFYPLQTAANLADVPPVTSDQLRYIWGWLSSCPGERPLASALEQALAGARKAFPG